MAKDVGGKVTLASGALSFSKADVFKKGIRIECKRTDSKSIKVEKEWFVKLRNQCLLEEVPVLNIQVQDEDWYIVRKEEFLLIQSLLESFK